jgi:hypothetical protein
VSRFTDLRSRALDRLAGLATRILGPSPEAADHIFAGLTASERRRALAFVARIRGSRGKGRTLEASEWAGEVAPWLSFAEVVVEREDALINAAVVIDQLPVAIIHEDERDNVVATLTALNEVLVVLFAVGDRAATLPHLRTTFEALVEGRPQV